MKIQLLLFLCTFSLSLFAQKTVSGIVIDKLSKEPLIGASIGIEGGLDGASTDSIGHFRFTTDETGPQILQVSYLGYQTAKVQLDLTQNQANLRISLEETPTDIGEVVISAGAFEASDEKKGTVLLPLDIVTIPGANGDITGALNTLPGTTVNGESGQLIVRGGAANETRIYIDGMAVRNYYTSPAPDVPVRSRFSPFQFKGTNFASGGYSAEYGQAMSSALILNTPDWPTQGGTNVGINSIGLNAGKTFIQERHAISTGINYFNLSPYMSLIKQDLDFPTAPQGGSAFAEGRIKSGDLGIIKYGGQASFNKVSIAYPKAPYETDAFSMSITNKNTRAYASWRQPVSDEWTLYAAGQFETNNDQFTPSTFSTFEVKNQAASGRFNASWAPNNRFRWRNGGEYNWVKIQSDFYPDPLNMSTAAVFSEVETYAGDRLVVRAGLRGERDFLIEKSNLAPRLSAAFKTGKDAQISASWGHFYQTPVDSLLFRNTNLDFERAQHYILNYQVTRNGRIFRLEGFYKKYDNLVRTVPVFNNSGNGFAQGVELFFRDRKTLQWGDYWLSYSFLDTRRIHRAYPISAMPEFAARHNASLVFKYFFSKKQISTSMSYTVQSGRPYFNPQNPEFLADRTPTYHNLSVQVAKLTSIWDNFTVLVLSVNNVLWLKQVYTYRYTAIPGTNPQDYYKQEIVPPARGFIFVGAFMNIGDKRKTVTKEEALE
ncbi:MAG: TonB-dependent receptor [Saprospiraceae bacterium]|nr:TonB-dependent receptor [Saprospiraceae bacterium]